MRFMSVFEDDGPPLASELAPDQLEIFEGLKRERARRGENVSIQELVNEKFYENKLLKSKGTNTAH